MDIKEQKIKKKIKELRGCNGNYQKINKRLKEKRLSWLRENKDKLNLSVSLPRRAYEMLLLEYMELNQEEVPVVYEDDYRITWQSFNFCPILGACKRLNLDTRVVCKEGFEESVQDFVSHIDPKLKFSRSYRFIRPYEEYCEESIELVE